MTGYENSPDYGGKEPNKYTLPIFIIAVLVFSVAGLYFAYADTVWRKCDSGKRITCVVDGDTFWKDGVKYRMAGYDTPEPRTGYQCQNEIKEAHKATNKVIDLFNSPNLEIVLTGKKGGYKRELVYVYSGGVNIGDILIRKGLAIPYRKMSKAERLKMHSDKWCQVD